MLHKIAFLLLVVGGLNWLLVGVFSWDIGSLLGGMGSPISRIVYILVGLAALVEIFTHKKNCKCCSVPKGSQSMSGQGSSMGHSGM